MITQEARHKYVAKVLQGDKPLLAPETGYDQDPEVLDICGRLNRGEVIDMSWYSGSYTPELMALIELRLLICNPFQPNWWTVSWSPMGRRYFYMWEETQVRQRR